MIEKVVKSYLPLVLTALFVNAASASAQEALIVSTQGSVDALVREFIVPRMKEQHGIDVSTTPSLSAPALAKAMAQRNSPQIDLFMLDAGPYIQGKAAGLWADVPVSDIPNLADTPSNLHDPKGVVYTHLLVGLLFDSSKVSPEPTSIADLENPKFKDKLAVPTFSSTFAFALLDAFDAKEGRNGAASSPVDAGFKKLKTIAPSVHSYYGGGAQLVNLFKQGEIEVAWGANHVAQGLGSGSPVKWKAPAEGASLSSVYAVIAEGSKNITAAGKFINIMLSPEFQALLAEKAGVAYVNTKTALSDEFKSTSPMTTEVISGGKQPDWAVFNKSRIEMNERWQRDLEAR